MPSNIKKRSQWSVSVHSPKVYPVNCVDAHILIVEARFNLKTLYHLSPFLEKVLRAMGLQMLP